ncbi:MAG: protein phosphatase 2C domain-containing protein, partial [Vitreimonas sp.]
MLTFVEAISLAGDRAKQNDDACGFTNRRAWVLDGATDLHGAPLTHGASDAAWLAHFANARLHAAEPGEPLREVVRMASVWAAQAFAAASGNAHYERWQSPIASLLALETTPSGVRGLDLGDCRVFALDASGAVHVAGGAADAADAETQLAARQEDADKPLLQRASTIDMLRAMRAGLNREGAHWAFGLDSNCTDHARSWSFSLARPAHLLLMTDGFSALVD